MEFLATILIVVAFFSFFIGLLGVMKGSVKFLRLRTRKASSLFVVAAFVVFIIGGAILPTTPDQQGTSQEKELKETKTAETKTAETKTEETKKDVVVSKPVTEEMAVHFVDVGQGAAQVIIAPNKKVMVIDAGNNDDEDKMVAYLKELGVSKVDILIGTHPDADHIGGMDAVIDSFDIGKIYMPKVQRNTQTFESVLQSIQNKVLTVTTAKAGIELDLDPAVQVKMIAPLDDTTSDANEMSAVVRLQYGEQSFLLTGDAGIPTEEKWLQSGELIQSTVLLTGHHGSNHSTSEAFLKAVQPKYAVIQVGKNSYGHPTSEVLERLHSEKINIYRNDTDGTIVFKTDGKEINVNKDAWEYTPAPKTQKQTAAPNQTQAKPAVTPPVSTPDVSNAIQASAVIDNSNPNQNEEVTVTVTVQDQNSQPVNGANVHLTLQFKSKDTVYEGVTNANGVASLSFRVGRAAAGFTVNGDITVTANGVTTTTQTAFTPK
ncbi:MBL fold metallo-hydrolase [Peribacillus huizhouensis]|uniref:Beta-lactamase superfamily II metal-dependent hydrolase n=1 Tax=Peribacillus huizhouensis TaxID=1501239 RepID=A0ABR6CMC3_9BACI|nr:MBL fold metallo-hydrolase [Peribacillus huizhouensis]MBA9026168.1 beta-lactamase superfamily II metal-dependent hydrolase [Peribacillus huizhouensis]